MENRVKTSGENETWFLLGERNSFYAWIHVVTGQETIISLLN